MPEQPVVSNYMNEEERVSYDAPYPDRYVHKLIQPIDGSSVGLLNELILCWKEHGVPSPDRIRHTSYATSINDANCPLCWSLWADGIYGD